MRKLPTILRVLKMATICVAVVALPAACSIVTGFAPVECGEGCQDV